MMGRKVNFDSQATVQMQHFFVAIARGLVEAQMALDECGRESIIAWEKEGLPPTVWTWAHCRFRIPLTFVLLPKMASTEKTQLAISSRKKVYGGLTFTFRYVLMPQEEEVL